MFYHALKRKSAIVKTLNCDDNKFCHVVDRWLMKPEESESPIYNMALEWENINLYELALKIKKRGGHVLHLITDCVVCEFDKFALKLYDNNNIIGCYHDQAQIVHKYRLEEGTKRVKHSKLQRYIRTDTYKYEHYSWSCMPAPRGTDFKGIVDSISDSERSCNIDGRAGTGVSYMVNSII